MFLRNLKWLRKAQTKPKNRWFIAIKRRGENIFDLSDLIILDSPSDVYYADPFVVEHAGCVYIFFEQYNYRKGVLAVAEMCCDSMSLKNKNVVVEENKHLSFPSVFADNESFYMTPEREQAGDLWIYKATSFPYQWEKFVLVSKGKFDDPILRKTGNKYQLWTTQGPDELRVFEAQEITGPWRLTIRRTVAYSRNAGHFIGDIRVAQDCSSVYGGAIKFLREDRVVHTIHPDWYPNLSGTHTFNLSENFLVIDGRIPL